LFAVLYLILNRHLYTQYIALDANFRLKQKDRGKIGDEGLTGGWGYFVDPAVFKQELRRVADHPQPQGRSTCDSSFAAVERANSRVNKGYVVTGVVAAIDSRHGMLLPNSVADLQKGER
jgi:hypothetical protein